jgi:hypothetical protein
VGGKYVVKRTIGAYREALTRDYDALLREASNRIVDFSVGDIVYTDDIQFDRPDEDFRIWLNKYKIVFFARVLSKMSNGYYKIEIYDYKVKEGLELEIKEKMSKLDLPSVKICDENEIKLWRKFGK